MSNENEYIIFKWNVQKEELMYLNEVKVKNYRSLKDVKLVLDKEKGTP